MIYKLLFIPKALKEWNKLNSEIKKQFIKKLKERLKNPLIPKDSLGKNLYKIKLKSAGYRLVYKIKDEKIILLVLCLGKRNRNQVYIDAFQRDKKK